MTEQKEVILSKEYLQKLQDELEYLKTKRRPEIAEKIKEARSFGDLSENADYDEAKNEQGEVESRIAKVEDMIRHAKTFEDSTNKDEVSVGSKVLIHDEEFDEELEYRIVGSTKSDILKGLISNESPLGKGLIGAKIGETVQVESPDGFSRYKILGISRE